MESEAKKHLPYTRHHNPLLNTTIHKARILRKRSGLKKREKWEKSIQTAGYNGARTVFGIGICSVIRTLVIEIWTSSFWF